MMRPTISPPNRHAHACFSPKTRNSTAAAVTRLSVVRDSALVRSPFDRRLDAGCWPGRAVVVGCWSRLFDPSRRSDRCCFGAVWRRCGGQVITRYREVSRQPQCHSRPADRERKYPVIFRQLRPRCANWADLGKPPDADSAVDDLSKQAPCRRAPIGRYHQSVGDQERTSIRREPRMETTTAARVGSTEYLRQRRHPIDGRPVVADRPRCAGGATPSGVSPTQRQGPGTHGSRGCTAPAAP